MTVTKIQFPQTLNTNNKNKERPFLELLLLNSLLDDNTAAQLCMLLVH